MINLQTFESIIESQFERNYQRVEVVRAEIVLKSMGTIIEVRVDELGIRLTPLVQVPEESVDFVIKDSRLDQPEEDPTD